MEKKRYQIAELAKLSGVSSRTLRYYEEIGLLKPKREPNSNYRYYDSTDVDNLQQILFFKEMGLELKEIKKAMTTLDKEKRLEILNQHLEELHSKQMKLNALITNVQSTIKSLKGEIMMSDQEKFNGLKDELLHKNEAEFKDEVIDKWGADAYEKSQKHFKNLSQEQFNHFMRLGSDIIETLKKIKERPNDEDLKKQVAKLHQEWITIAWGHYNKEVHLNVVNMYLEDERFQNYYDQYGDGIAKILRDAVHTHLKSKTDA